MIFTILVSGRARYGQDSLNPENNESSDTNCGEECVHAAVISSWYTSPILQPAKHAFELMALFIQNFVVRYCAFSVLFRRNAKSDPFFKQAISEPIRVITSIRKKVLGNRKITKQFLGPLVIRHLIRRQIHKHGPEPRLLHRRRFCKYYAAISIFQSSIVVFSASAGVIFPIGPSRR